MVWAGLINDLVARHLKLVALFCAISISSYLRPSSLLALRPEDIQPPLLGIQTFWTLLMHPEGSRPSKTGEFDLSIVMDSPWMQFLGPLLRVLKGKARGEAVWGFGYPVVLKELKQSCERLGIDRVTPYQARHSGASIDRAGNHRTQLEVQRRGGWKQMRSMARYEKSARLAQRGARLTAAQRAHFRQCELLLEDILVWGKTVPLPAGISAGGAGGR